MKKISTLLFISGIVCFVGGIALLILIYLPVIKAETLYTIASISRPRTANTKTITPADTSFGIVVPKIGANARIVKNVNATDEKIYQRALTKGVAHARGSSLPDEPGNMFLFAHSSDNFYNANRYNSIFYLLTKLEKDDVINVFYQNEKYTYAVTKKSIVDAKNVSYMKGSSKTKKLTLMTCWPPGTTLKRLVVEAYPQ